MEFKTNIVTNDINIIFLSYVQRKRSIQFHGAYYLLFLKRRYIFNVTRHLNKNSAPGGPSVIASEYAPSSFYIVTQAYNIALTA